MSNLCNLGISLVNRQVEVRDNSDETLRANGYLLAAGGASHDQIAGAFEQRTRDQLISQSTRHEHYETLRPWAQDTRAQVDTQRYNYSPLSKTVNSPYHPVLIDGLRLGSYNGAAYSYRAVSLDQSSLLCDHLKFAQRRGAQPEVQKGVLFIERRSTSRVGR
jgi:hypothetical protein